MSPSPRNELLSSLPLLVEPSGHREATSGHGESIMLMASGINENAWNNA